MLTQTDFLFRIVNPVAVFKASGEPLSVAERFPEFVDIRLDLPSYSMFADLLVETSTNRICGFSFQIDPRNMARMTNMLPLANTDYVAITHRVVPRNILSFNDPATQEHRLNVTWRPGASTTVVLAQLDEVQWVIGTHAASHGEALIGISCIRISEATSSLFSDDNQ